MNDFNELNLSPVMRGNLAKHSFVTPTPIQAAAIPPSMAGNDVVATAQTGTGKTLAFAIPVVERLLKSEKPVAKTVAIDSAHTDQPKRAQQQLRANENRVQQNVRAIVLSPTRELAMQIQETMAKLVAGTALRSTVVVGGMDESRQLKQIRSGAQIIIATPGRLCDFLERRLVDLRGVQSITLDEADRMLDMGFLPSIKMILQALPEQRQTLLFSATIEKSVAHLVASYVRNPVRIAIGTTTKPAERVDLHVYEVEHDRKIDLLARLLRDEPDGAFLVFSRTKHGADRLATRLARFGHRATRIHGDRTQGQRNSALQGFKNGDFRVLVATDVAARGIHVDNVAHVVNFDLPQVPEDFIHRAGRTGRAGAKGVASTFHTRGERGDIRQIERALSVKMTRRDIPAGEAPVEKPMRFEEAEMRQEPAVQIRQPNKVVVSPAEGPRKFFGMSKTGPKNRFQPARERHASPSKRHATKRRKAL